MRWIKAFSFLMTLGLLGYIGWYFFSIKREEEQKNTYQSEQMFIARFEHAKMKSYLQDYGSAEREFLQLIADYPNDLRAKLELANLFYYQKRNREALELIETIKANERNSKINLLLADIHLSMKDYPEAEALYREYLNKHPGDIDIKFKLAQVLSWKKHYDEAAVIYQQLLKREPGNIQLRRHYARVLMWMGKHNEAAEEMKRTLPPES